MNQSTNREAEIIRTRLIQLLEKASFSHGGDAYTAKELVNDLAALAAQTKDDSTEPKCNLCGHPGCSSLCPNNFSEATPSPVNPVSAQAREVAAPEDADIDVSGAESRSRAWFAVVGALNKACPGWMNRDMNAMDSAVDAILALRPKAQPLTELERGVLINREACRLFPDDRQSRIAFGDGARWAAHGIASPTKGEE